MDANQLKTIVSSLDEDGIKKLKEIIEKEEHERELRWWEKELHTELNEYKDIFTIIMLDYKSAHRGDCIEYTRLCVQEENVKFNCSFKNKESISISCEFYCKYNYPKYYPKLTLIINDKKINSTNSEYDRMIIDKEDLKEAFFDINKYKLDTMTNEQFYEFMMKIIKIGISDGRIE